MTLKLTKMTMSMKDYMTSDQNDNKVDDMSIMMQVNSFQLFYNNEVNIANMN